MHLLKLHRARDPQGQSVLATDVINHSEDTYFCPSCGCLVILQQANQSKAAWFEHDEREAALGNTPCIYQTQRKPSSTDVTMKAQ